jgi:parallel beta-helix repeat protein
VSDSIVAHNVISSNDEEGIYLFESNNDKITDNLIFNNSLGIYMNGADDNILHHNSIVKNGNQTEVMFGSSGNIWDDSMGEGNFWSDYNGLDDGNGGRTAGDGIGDTEIPHPFTDQGYGYYQLDNYPLMDPVGNYVFLNEGWNLISIPFIQLNTDLGTVLSSITGLYSAVQWYNVSDAFDPWKHNHVSKLPSLNDFSTINHKMGFWIHIVESGEILFQYSGTHPTENQSITIHKGWNQVGYPSLTSYNRTTGLNNLTFGLDVDCIQWYDAATKSWHIMGPDDYFVPGKGYWMHSKVDAEWEVPL